MRTLSKNWSICDQLDRSECHILENQMDFGSLWRFKMNIQKRPNSITWQSLGFLLIQRYFRDSWILVVFSQRGPCLLYISKASFKDSYLAEVSLVGMEIVEIDFILCSASLVPWARIMTHLLRYPNERDTETETETETGKQSERSVSAWKPSQLHCFRRRRGSEEIIKTQGHFGKSRKTVNGG